MVVYLVCGRDNDVKQNEIRLWRSTQPERSGRRAWGERRRGRRAGGRSDLGGKTGGSLLSLLTPSPSTLLSCALLLHSHHVQSRRHTFQRGAYKDQQLQHSSRRISPRAVAHSVEPTTSGSGNFTQMARGRW